MGIISSTYFVSLYDNGDYEKKYNTEAMIVEDKKKYFLKLRLPDSEECMATFELVEKKKRK